MIKIIAEFFIKSDSIGIARQLAEELVLTTRKETGCIAYDLFEDTADYQHLVIVEEWESQEVLDIHSASEHFTRLVPQISAQSYQEAIIHTYSKVV